MKTAPSFSNLLGVCADEGEVHKETLGSGPKFHLAASILKVPRSPNDG